MSATCHVKRARICQRGSERRGERSELARSWPDPKRRSEGGRENVLEDGGLLIAMVASLRLVSGTD